jgi:hypothetical protein
MLGLGLGLETKQQFVIYDNEYTEFNEYMALFDITMNETWPNYYLRITDYPSIFDVTINGFWPKENV